MKEKTVSRLLVFCVFLNILLPGCAVNAPVGEPPTVTSVSSTEAPELSTEVPELSTEPPASTAPAETPPPAAEPEDEDFVRVLDHISNARQGLPYATVNNFTGQRIYDFTDVYLRYGTVKKLAMVCDELAQQGVGIKIWDGFRPVAAQAKLYEICPDPTFVSHPVTGSRSHCRGNTVDLTLVDLETGEELQMPTGYDNFTAYADRDYRDCSPEAAENARLLEDTMERWGFKPYFAEWWHFTDEESYPVDEYFDPAVPSLWAANCQEYISLRKAPGGEVIKRISKGEILELQSWEGKYALVSYGETEGYVLTSYVLPDDDSYFRSCLTTVLPTNVYSYGQMLTDLQLLHTAYPKVTDISSIGTSEQGRQIPVLRIGNLEARYHVLLQGAIHGREHLSAWLLMAMADYWLNHGILGYGDVCYHLIPMTNPDGVVISQTAVLTPQQQAIYERNVQLGYTSADEREYAQKWKANADGVDINRNFSDGWEQCDDRTAPSAQRYQGEEPFSSAEAAALRDYTLRYAFDATISYHATGSLIYYEYGDNEAVKARSKSLAKAVREISGYELESGNSIDGAGYKDWAMESLQIPSVTVEVGCEEAALAEREIYSIFARNYRVLAALARWLQI